MRPPGVVIIVINDAIVVGVRNEPVPNIAKRFAPHHVVGGIDDAVEVVVAGDVAQETADFAVVVGSRIYFKIGFAIFEGKDARVFSGADGAAGWAMKVGLYVEACAISNSWS